MSYDGNFQKGMLAVTYYKRSANMSKQSTKSTIFFFGLLYEKPSRYGGAKKKRWVTHSWEQGQS